ncbi:unnamed protein product [Protopolystoma xenopodis]|uniref:Uncharacterized protein n=1 Tax=Protopolystoma xenopodis TaxID=117903 RepID=A0A448WE55_9PLAT|nr:unnamed protein product [Protopolystoma xenopodis]
MLNLTSAPTFAIRPELSSCFTPLSRINIARPSLSGLSGHSQTVHMMQVGTVAVLLTWWRTCLPAYGSQGNRTAKQSMCHMPSTAKRTQNMSDKAWYLG